VGVMTHGRYGPTASCVHVFKGGCVGVMTHGRYGPRASCVYVF